MPVPFLRPPVAALLPLLVLSACAVPGLPSMPSMPDSAKVQPHDPGRSMAIVALQKVPSLPGYLRVNPVSFDNHYSAELDRQFTVGDGKGTFGLVAIPSDCFAASQVCIQLNMPAGRYQFDGFGYGVGRSATVYQTGGPREAAPGALDTLLGKRAETVFNAADHYFVVPAGTVAYVGSYEWSNTTHTASGTVRQEPEYFFRQSPAPVEERSALTALLGDAVFRDRYPAWIPVVQRRLDRLRAPVAAATPKAAPAAAKKTSPKKKKSKR